MINVLFCISATWVAYTVGNKQAPCFHVEPHAHKRHKLKWSDKSSIL